MYSSGYQGARSPEAITTPSYFNIQHHKPKLPDKLLYQGQIYLRLKFLGTVKWLSNMA